MNKTKELNQRLLFFNPEITFDGMIGGVKLVMLVDAFNRHINWIVYEGDHCSEFSDFQEACAYYVKVIGEE